MKYKVSFRGILDIKAKDEDELFEKIVEKFQENIDKYTFIFEEGGE